MALVMEVSFPGGKRINADFNGFTVKTDQGVKGGGEGSAPEPFQYFLASLATCAGIYALNFMEARKIPTQGLRLSQTAHWDPEKKRLAKVEINLDLPPDFPEKYHKAIKRAVDLCAVKKAIADPPEFEIIVSA